MGNYRKQIAVSSTHSDGIWIRIVQRPDSENVSQMSCHEWASGSRRRIMNVPTCASGFKWRVTDIVPTSHHAHCHWGSGGVPRSRTTCVRVPRTCHGRPSTCVCIQKACHRNRINAATPAFRLRSVTEVVSLTSGFRKCVVDDVSTSVATRKTRHGNWANDVNRAFRMCHKRRITGVRTQKACHQRR